LLLLLLLLLPVILVLNVVEFLFDTFARVIDAELHAGAGATLKGKNNHCFISLKEILMM